MKGGKLALVIGAIGGLAGLIYMAIRPAKASTPTPTPTPTPIPTPTPTPTPVPNIVAVSLLNPPSSANQWGLTLYDQSGVKSQSVTVATVSGEASFTIPADWQYPLRFWIQIINYLNGSVTVLHQAQSVESDWPYYIASFIPQAGNYYYNVSTKTFQPK